jgi:hypothetical protein
MWQHWKHAGFPEVFKDDLFLASAGQGVDWSICPSALRVTSVSARGARASCPLWEEQDAGGTPTLPFKPDYEVLKLIV